MAIISTLAVFLSLSTASGLFPKQLSLRES